MTNWSRRAVLGTATGIAAGLAVGRAAHAAAPTFALVQTNQQALFFNQMNAGAQEAAEINPAAEVAVVPGAAHMLPFDDLEGFLASVREFAGRVTRHPVR